MQKLRPCLVWPQPKLEQTRQIYQDWGENYYLKKDKIELAFSSSFDEMLDRLEPYRKNNRLLDVGCSLGAFILAAKDRGRAEHGVEISRPVALYARDIRKLNLFCGTMEEAKFKNDYFDVINMSALLEHVHDPLGMASEAYRILRKGGALSASVPSFTSLSIKILGKKYRYIAKEHLFYFTKDSIMKLLERAGFKTAKISSEYFSPLTFIEDLRGVAPNTLKTDKQEKELLEAVKRKKINAFVFRPCWKIFMFLLKKLNLGESLRIFAIK